MTLLVYYDLTSAESFALSEIVRTLDPPPSVEWRGVQTDPGLPEPMALLDRRARGRVEIEIADATRAVPGLDFVLPKGKPNTRRALQAIASVDRVHAARAADFRTILFRQYWWSGSDLSDVGVIRRAADEAGVPPWAELEQQAVQSTQVAWELQWRTERLGGVPRVIRSDGQILWGVSDESAVRSFLAGPGRDAR